MARRNVAIHIVGGVPTTQVEPRKKAGDVLPDFSEELAAQKEATPEFQSAREAAAFEIRIAAARAHRDAKLAEAKLDYDEQVAAINRAYATWLNEQRKG